MIGIIIPPGQIKKMVQKTALHVAKNGSDFQKALIQMEQHKPEFAFLLKDNPYRGYYDHMVAEYSRKLLAQNSQNRQEQALQTDKKQVKDQIVENKEQAQYLEKVFEQVKQPDPDKFSALLPQKITRVQIAMILHTAQYAAINGKNFLIALSQRQKNNPQFQFLRSSSDNHSFFNKIIEAYEAVLTFGQDDISKLQTYINDRQQILNNCREAYQYHRQKQEQSKGKKNQGQNKKQNNIDWNDFQLVQTIVFEGMKAKNGKDDAKLRPSLYNNNRNMEEKILSEPKKKGLLQQCHVCNKNILATQITKHLKTCLGSSNQKPKNVVSSIQGEHVDITKNLQNLSVRRPDIFGGQGEKIKLDDIPEQAENQEKLIWDGQSEHITRATASAAMLSNEQKKIRQKLLQDHKTNNKK